MSLRNMLNNKEDIEDIEVYLIGADDVDEYMKVAGSILFEFNINEVIDRDMCDLLLNHGGSVLPANSEDESPNEMLLTCCYTNLPNLIYSCLKGRKNQGYDINSRVTTMGGSFLHTVVVNEDEIEPVKLLIEAGIDPNIKDQDGHSAIWYAKHVGNYDIVDYLSSVGADISMDFMFKKNDFGDQP